MVGNLYRMGACKMAWAKGNADVSELSASTRSFIRATFAPVACELLHRYDEKGDFIVLCSFGYENDWDPVCRRYLSRTGRPGNKIERRFLWNEVEGSNSKTMRELYFAVRDRNNMTLFGRMIVSAESQMIVEASAVNIIDIIWAHAQEIDNLRRDHMHLGALSALLRMLTFDLEIADQTGAVVYTPYDDDRKNRSADVRNSYRAQLIRQALKQHAASGNETPLPLQQVTWGPNGGGSETIFLVELDAKTGDGRRLFALLTQREEWAPAAEMLSRAFALTPSEASVVQGVVSGLKIEEVSKALSLTPNTVRTYLKRSFSKVGVTNQAQLLHRIYGRTVPLKPLQELTSIAPKRDRKIARTELTRLKG